MKVLVCLRGCAYARTDAGGAWDGSRSSGAGRAFVWAAQAGTRRGAWGRATSSGRYYARVPGALSRSHTGARRQVEHPGRDRR